MYLLVFPLLFPCTFSSICSFYLVVFPFLSFYFLYIFSFLFLLVMRLYPLKLFSTREYICIWSKSLGCGCERYPDFRVEEDKYWLGDLHCREISATDALDDVCLVQI
jgi:hypothetical protein